MGPDSTLDLVFSTRVVTENKIMVAAGKPHRAFCLLAVSCLLLVVLAEMHAFLFVVTQLGVRQWLHISAPR